MKALVIGGTRFIGAHVVRRLHEDGFEVTVLHRGRSSNPILPDVRHVIDADAEYPITRFPSAVHAHWDTVVHMVAMGLADASAAVQTFSGRTARLAIVSSSDVYRAYGRLVRSEPGPIESVPLKEDAPLRTVLYPYRGMEAQLGGYATRYEKILVERAVREQDQLDWTILRLPKVYGPEDNGDLATIYGCAAWPEWRWTHGHVRNVAAAIAMAATMPLASNEIFNVGEELTPTMGQRLANLPARGSAPPGPIFNFAQPLVLDTGKIRRLLGYDDVIDEFEEMRLLAEMRDHDRDAITSGSVPT